MDLNQAAVLSEDGKYRYWLKRVLNADKPLPRILWVMLNPSTADHTKDDPTVKRITGITKALGGGSFGIVNLFGLRSPSPVDLKISAAHDPVGPLNGEAWASALSWVAGSQEVFPDHDNDEHTFWTGRIVCAWGKNPYTGPLWFKRLGEMQIASFLQAADTFADVRMETSALDTGTDFPMHPLLSPKFERLRLWPR